MHKKARPSITKPVGQFRYYKIKANYAERNQDFTLKRSHAKASNYFSAKNVLNNGARSTENLKIKLP